MNARKLADLIAESDAAAAGYLAAAETLMRRATPKQREQFLADCRRRIEEVREGNRAWLQRLTESTGGKAQ
jgi:hypothetical protein